MTTDTINRDLFFFLCGFCATAEGFNCECGEPYLAPLFLGQDYGGLVQAFEALKSDKTVYGELLRLFAQAKTHLTEEDFFPNNNVLEIEE